MPWQTVPHLSVPSSTHLSRSEFSKSDYCVHRAQLQARHLFVLVVFLIP